MLAASCACVCGGGSVQNYLCYELHQHTSPAAEMLLHWLYGAFGINNNWYRGRVGTGIIPSPASDRVSLDLHGTFESFGWNFCLAVTFGNSDRAINNSRPFDNPTRQI